MLRHFPNLRDLGDAAREQLAHCRSEMSAESFKRCRHIVSENERVRQAKAAILEGDPVRLGAIMTEAHASQRDDFECSVEEVDFLVSTAIGLEGCYGARLTGEGFGGCTVNLVRAQDAQALGGVIKEKYRNAFSREAEIYICDPADGAVRRNAARVSNRTGEASSC